MKPEFLRKIFEKYSKPNFRKIRTMRAFIFHTNWQTWRN